MCRAYRLLNDGQIAAGGLARMYFRADNTRARGPGVEVTDIEQIEIQLWSPGTRWPPVARCRRR
ncbi:hypothetical protein ACFYMX_33690 [Streptomyces griseofuscus]|uniref:hypothetical protein n=2 Tax=Streptomyces TaxID=1883 RepID=UPI00367CE628